MGNLKDLHMYTGTEHHYRHISGFKYTDGVQYVANEAGAYWLLDKILFLMREKKFQTTALQEYTFWTLKVDLEKKSGVLTADDGNGKEIHREEIEYTDFPEPEIKVWFEYGVLILPSEH